MNVIFHDISYKNIMSVGAKPIHIQLDQSLKTLVTGQNGAGKSTFLEALSFLLYGKPFRDIKKGQLVNAINGKALLVEGNLSVGPNKFYIKRGIKPNVLEIHKNGEPIPELASVTEFQRYFEEELLGISFQSFKQVIVLGTAGYKPFLELPAGERRTLVEDLLDLSVFSEMDRINKAAIKVAKQETDIIDVKLQSNLNEQEAEMRSIQKQKDMTESNIRSWTSTVVGLVNDIKDSKARLEQEKSDLANIVDPSPVELEERVTAIRGRLEQVKSEVETRTRDLANIADQSIAKLQAEAEEKEINAHLEDAKQEKRLLELNSAELACTTKMRADLDALSEKPDDTVAAPVLIEVPERLCFFAEIRSLTNEIGNLQSTLTLKSAHLEFHEGGGECPTCGSAAESSGGNIEQLRVDITALNDKIADRYDAITELNRKTNERTSEINEINAENTRLLSDFEKMKWAQREAVNNWQRTHDKIASDYALEMQRYSAERSTIQTGNLPGKIAAIHQERDAAISGAVRSYEANVAVVKSRIDDVAASVEREVQSEYEKFEASKIMTEHRRNSIGEQIAYLQRDIDKDTARAHELKSQIDIAKETVYDESKLNELKQARTELADRKTKLFDELRARQTILVMLKDNGVKSQIVKRYIPVFNKKINQYLASMDADYVFALDEEFNETIKSRGREEFSYTSFSQGERARINVALLFTWRDVASMVSGTNINLLVLDELFDSATDAEGVKAINSLLDASGSNTFVISHRAENMNDSFDRHLRMVKKGRFTTMEELA